MEATSRIDRVCQALRAADVSALAVVPGANLLYLLGLTMHSSERLAIAFIAQSGDVRMVLPALEQPRAAAEAQTEIQFYPWHDAEGYAQALGQCLDDLQLPGQLGVEYTTMRVMELRAIEQFGEVETVDATELIAGLRMTKDAAELDAMRAAVRAVEAGLRAAIDAIKPGATEREIAEVWERTMREAGSQGPSFTTIVASGPNSANPHYTTGDRRLQPGDLIVLDGGAQIGGYVSDITRTVALGEPSDEARKIYETVLAANRAGVAASKPGANGAQIDGAARQVIEDAGYGQYFIHRTGHGLGMEIHEPPYLHATSTAPLAAGTTFTVEPGVYVAGIGGVRIEDDVVLTENGAECLTNFDRELIIR
ncbi:MAG: aminopeptidase P family protein [Chloroflexi bacterium]|nr:aminopeptidase P family protein [Chloroflexota bacterium]